MGVLYHSHRCLSGHKVRFKAPRGLHIIAGCNELWFCVSAGVCFGGQKDKQSWRLTVWAQSGRGVHKRHFEGHVLVQIHSNLIQKLHIFLAVNNLGGTVLGCLLMTFWKGRSRPHERVLISMDLVSSLWIQSCIKNEPLVFGNWLDKKTWWDPFVDREKPFVCDFCPNYVETRYQCSRYPQCV